MPSTAGGWVNLQDWVAANKDAGQAQMGAAEAEAKKKADEAVTWTNAANKAASAQGTTADKTSQWGTAQGKADIAKGYYDTLARGAHGAAAITGGSMWDEAAMGGAQQSPGSVGGYDQLQQYMGDVQGQSATRLGANQRNAAQSVATRTNVDRMQGDYAGKVQAQNDAIRLANMDAKAARGESQTVEDLNWRAARYPRRNFLDIKTPDFTKPPGA